MSRASWELALPQVLVLFRKDSLLSQADPSMQPVGDAKSLFDVLVKDCDSRKEDNRTANELAVINESLSRVGCAMRRIPHTNLPIGQITKLAKPGQSNCALLAFSSNACFRIRDEANLMSERVEDPAPRLRSKAACARALGAVVYRGG